MQRGASMHHSASKRASAVGAPTGQVNDNDNIKVLQLWISLTYEVL